MAIRKDKIFQSFIEHQIINKEINGVSAKLPTRTLDGLKSDILIIKIISLIVDQMESKEAIKEKVLFDQVNKIIKLS